jgi:hypothetical protein
VLPEVAAWQERIREVRVEDLRLADAAHDGAPDRATRTACSHQRSPSSTLLETSMAADKGVWPICNERKARIPTCRSSRIRESVPFEASPRQLSMRARERLHTHAVTQPTAVADAVASLTTMPRSTSGLAFSQRRGAGIEMNPACQRQAMT